MFVVTGLRILTLKLLLTAIIVHGGSFQINTCCPKGYKFKDYSLGLFKSSQFVCEEVEEDYDSNQDVLEGYSIRQSDKIMIPTCDDPFVVKITSEISLSRSSCIVKLDSEYYAVTCAARESTKLNLIQKCCPAGHSYDGENRECVPSDVSIDVFYMLFNNPVIFQSESFTCSESKVIIEYIWDYHKFKVEDSSLVVSNVEKYFDSDSYCLDTVIPGNESRIGNKNGSDAVIRRINFMARTCNSPLVCNSIPCIRKCCKDNEKLVEIDQKTTCVHHQNDHNFVFHKFVRNDSNNVVEADLVQPKEFGILRGQNCAKYKLEPDEYPEDIHYINHEDGSLYIPSIPDTYDHSKYCVEFFQGEDYEDNDEEEDQEIKAYTFVCFEDQKTDAVRFILYPVGLIVSSAFCIVTLIVYLFVPKLRNLPGKILVCLVFCLLGCYTALAIGQLFPTDGLGCYPLALFLYFSFMGAFTWTNIMCIDIWLTFSSARNHHSIRKRREKRKILIYMIYGWSIPSLLTLMIVGLDKWQEVPKDFRPRFGGTRCWFEYLNLIPHLLYFIFPAGTLVFINVVLFVLTLRYINKVKREICRMQSSNVEKPLLRRRFGVDKARFAMNIKIFIVMGVSWAVEIVSTLVYDRKNLYFWFLTDFFNTLQGVFVFFIFVFKWKVWYAILDRIGIKHKKRYKPPPTSNLLRLKSMESCSSLLNSNVTNVTSVSRRTRETDRSDAE